MTKGNPRRQKSWCRPERLIMHDTSRHETRRLEKDQRERLLYLCDWLPPDYGAVGQYSLLFARELAAEGRDVVLAGLSSRATHGVEIHKIVIAIVRENLSSAAWDEMKRISKHRLIALEILPERLLLAPSSKKLA